MQKSVVMEIRGLYVVTDPDQSGVRLTTAVEQAVAGGARTVQYRQKDKNSRAYVDDAVALRTITRRRKRTLIINDDPILATNVDADGVHLGRSDVDVVAARSIIGTEKIIGVSCYDDLDRALLAQQQGADYVAFGSFFPSSTKPGAVKASINLLQQAKRQLSLPLVAIGGIDRFNAPLLIEAGADAIAVISAVFAQKDVRAAAKLLAGLFNRS